MKFLKITETLILNKLKCRYKEFKSEALGLNDNNITTIAYDGI